MNTNEMNTNEMNTNEMNTNEQTVTVSVTMDVPASKNIDGMSASGERIHIVSATSEQVREYNKMMRDGSAFIKVTSIPAGRKTVELTTTTSNWENFLKLASIKMPDKKARTKRNREDIRQDLIDGIVSGEIVKDGGTIRHQSTGRLLSAPEAEEFAKLTGEQIANIQNYKAAE